MAVAFTVFAVLTLGGSLVVARRLTSSVPLHVPSPDGSLTLRPPRGSAIMLGVFALFPAGVLGLVTIQGWWRGGKGVTAALVATSLAAAAAAYVIASAVRSRVVVHDTGIERVGVFRRRLFGWTAVARIAFNPIQRWFFLTMSDGSHLWIRADIAGIGDFARIVLRRVKATVLATGPDVCEVLSELAEAARAQAGDPPGPV